MKMFEFLDKLDRESVKDFDIPVEKPRVVEGKVSDIKEYKRQYYLKNIQVYNERNKMYRKENRDKCLELQRLWRKRQTNDTNEE